MFKFLIITKVIFSILLYSAIANADASVRNYPIEEIVQSRMMDSETIEIKLSMTYPNGCYKPYYSTVLTDEKELKIYVLHLAHFISSDFCTMALLKESQNIQIAKPSRGIYEIYDIYNKKLLAKIEITNQGAYIY